MRPLFPPWTNLLRRFLIVAALGTGAYLAVVVTFGFSAKATDRGYQPEQPVPFSHRIHAGQLGLDCRYCHSTVERQTHAAVPSTETCMGCHERIHPESPKLAPIRESWATGRPVPWIRVHDLPDYAYFNHAAHIQKGVGCASCHGRVDQMEIVYQVHDLSMGWCLNCHRDPDPHLRPKHLVTQMDYEPRDLESQKRLRIAYEINPRESCGTCHR